MPMVATMVRSGSWASRRRIAASAAAAIAPTIKGAAISAAPKPHPGWPPIACAIHHAITAPSMKKAPCAMLTTRITPKTRLSPDAVSASTAAVTAPSRSASMRCGPNSISGRSGSSRRELHAVDHEPRLVDRRDDRPVLALELARHRLDPRLPIVLGVVPHRHPGQASALAPGIEHDPLVIGRAAGADDDGAVLEPVGSVGIGHGAVQVEGFEPFLREPVLHVARPVPAQAPRLDAEIHLGVVDHR